MQRASHLLFALAFLVSAGCGDDPPITPGVCGPDGITDKSRFPAGSADGHADPAGAKAAGQARAGRIRDASLIRQVENRRQKVTTDDYLLINDKIAVYIEATGESDGYHPFGGEILAIEPVGSDGKPSGISQYGETLVLLSRQVVDPESVTVMSDGSDGKAAIVRAAGRLRNIPFLDTFAPLLPPEYDLPAALDYVLEPGAERVVLRLSLMNHTVEDLDFAGSQNIGFFHSARSELFTPQFGFGDTTGLVDWAGFDAGTTSFAFRLVGQKMRSLLDVSGFLGFQGAGLKIASCETRSVDYAELIPARGGIDALREVVRRVDGQPAWREVKGKLTDQNGAPIAGALVHAQDEGGKYLTRARTDIDGNYFLHAPNTPISLVPTHGSWPTPGPLAVAADAKTADLTLGASGRIVVRANDGTKNNLALPVRVQVVPASAPAAPPDAFGVDFEANGRLHQSFATDGMAALSVPPGKHRVIVSRGFEYELFDQTVTVDAGKTVTLDAQLLHSVDSTGVMCADFHIHSNYSADSTDPVDFKVKGAIADGLEIPVSSEHEWIIDFQPTIEKMGLKQWAFGFPSEEFTTFTWGHFGIVPIQPREGRLNNGAVAWVGKKPPEVFQTIAAMPEKPVLIINHPSGGGVGAYFSTVHFRRDMATGDPDMWSDQFEAVEVFNDSDLESNRNKSVADWFALLDSGKMVWAVGNSDSHKLRSSPVGYPRTCLRFGHDDPAQLSAETVRDALRKGAATVSGGLFMTVVGPGGAGPGAMLPAGTMSPEITVTVQAPSWLEAKQLEVIVDGQTSETIQLQESTMQGPVRHYEARVVVKPPKAKALHWVVFHASSPGRDLAPVAPGRKPFAVSNPIFF